MSTTTKYFFLFFIFAIFMKGFAQFTLSGEFRPRTEYRQGFGSIIPKGVDPGMATSTRARLNFNYKTDKYNLFVSLQDVMVWGENRQIKPNDENNSFAVFEAWADLKLIYKLSLKLGRQMIAYDDHRIMGTLGWAQQARNHDAALLRYKNGSFMFDLGFAYNQDFNNPSGYISQGNIYNTKGFFSYKTMQYLYLKKKWENLSTSLLFMNNGFQEVAENKLSNLTTTGVHLAYKKGAWSAVSNIFTQFGERQGETDVKDAFLASLDLSYQATKKLGLGIGGEVISGNAPNSDTGTTSAFFPLYGTNHKFNGLMDYFYVGNHANSVGLVDFHGKVTYKLDPKANISASLLSFLPHKELASGEDYLGTELDLVYSRKFEGYGLKVGYSQMFASDGMYALKGVGETAAKSTQNWAWIMLIIKPKFFSSKK